MKAYQINIGNRSVTAGHLPEHPEGRSIVIEFERENETDSDLPTAVITKADGRVKTAITISIEAAVALQAVIQAALDDHEEEISKK